MATCLMEKDGATSNIHVLASTGFAMHWWTVTVPDRPLFHMQRSSSALPHFSPRWRLVWVPLLISQKKLFRCEARDLTYIRGRPLVFFTGIKLADHREAYMCNGH